MSKQPIDFSHGDDLSDLLGGPASPVAREMPADDQFARIRERGIGHEPVAKAFKVACSRCGGSGRYGSLGPCFKCQGKGHFERKTAPAKLAANRAKAAERRDAVKADARLFFAEKYPAEWAYLRAELSKGPGGSWGEILGSIAVAIEKYGELSVGRLAVLTRGVERQADRAASRVEKAAAQQEQVKAVDVANIVACFQRAREAGLQRFTLRFAGAHFQVDRNDPELIWVSAAGYGTAKFGRIQGGVYKPGWDANAAVIAKIAEISKDPMAAARAYAQQTASCSVCGRHLENEVSVDEGIGPICAGRLNYKPGKKFVPVAEGDF